MASTSLLELTRSTHEEIERLQKAILDELNPDKTPKTFKENVVQTTKVKLYLDRASDARTRLAEYYIDKDGLRREEIAGMSGQGPDVYKIFYDRIRDLKEYHRKFPSDDVQRLEDVVKVPEEDVLPLFTGEEGYGRSLDLLDFFERYRNLPIVRHALPNNDPLAYDFLTYLRDVSKFNDNLALKDADYRRYAEELAGYLESFLQRSQPLLDLPAELRAINEEFERQWESGEFQGWSAEPPPPEPDDPLFCVACDKRFAKATVFVAHLSGKKHQAAAERLLPGRGKAREAHKEVYSTEFRIGRLCEKHLSEPLENTRINFEKKLARNMSAQAADALGEGEVPDASDDDADDGADEQPEVRLTIANYPVGWDGKPIPYWLYKLHGLGVEYKCEICGNQSYWGRKAYEKHFQEWRHAYGMRCLGIVNSKHFHDITKINDALILWEKIKKDQTKSKFRNENDEEYEDRDGNVYSKKTYEDLRRQGLWVL